MRVAMFTNTFSPQVGGVERSVASTAAELRRQGHPCVVFAPAHAGEDSDPQTERLPAIESFLGSRFSYRVPGTGHLARRFDAFSPEVVHVHHPFMLGEAGFRRGRARGLPVVFTSHTRWERFVPGAPPWLRRLAQQLPVAFANLCDLVVAPTPTIARLLERRGVRRPVRVVPTGIDLALQQSGDRTRGRGRWQLPVDARVVGHVGRLVPEKNLEPLLGGVARFLKVDSRRRFLLVGEGRSAGYLRQGFAERGVTDQVLMTGLLEGRALADAYAAMDVFAFTSRTDTQGIVLVEALASGCPVVALDAPGARDLVDASCGVLVPAGLPREQQVVGLTEAMEFAFDRHHELSDGARRRAERYGIEASAEALLEIYLAAREAGSRRAGRPQDDSPWARVERRLRAEARLLLQKSSLAVSPWL
jgi:glycosyltransferase involved in cell wall biosynthesis